MGFGQRFWRCNPELAKDKQLSDLGKSMTNNGKTSFYHVIVMV